MTFQNKETYKELILLATSLQKTTSQMRDNYNALRRFIYQELFLVFVFVLLFLFFICNRRFLISYQTLLFLVVLLIVVCLIGLTLTKITKLSSSYKGHFIKGKQTLQTMSDKAEWTRYKRRLIIKGSEIEVSEAVDNFFSVSDKLWSPTRVEKNYYLLLVTLLPLILLSTLIAVFVYILEL